MEDILNISKIPIPPFSMDSPSTNGTSQPNLAPRSDLELAKSQARLLSDTNDSNKDEHCTPVMDGMDDSTQCRDSENALGGSSTLQFAMNVEASVTHNIDSRRDPYQTPVTAISPSTPEYHVNPWQRGDPHRKDALSSTLDNNHGEDFPEASLSSFPHSFPQRHVADLLFECYFSTVNLIWPFLIEDECRNLLKGIWKSPERSDPVWIAQLNLIFCLSCQSYKGGLDSESPFEDNSKASLKFYCRARKFIVANAFDLTSTSMLQALLLMAQYEQSTLRSRQCYLTIGHAVRLAQELGLHIPLSDGSYVSPLLKELRLRLWWSCFSLDR